jgi:hypothetical protein
VVEDAGTKQLAFSKWQLTAREGDGGREGRSESAVRGQRYEGDGESLDGRSVERRSGRSGVDEAGNSPNARAEMR